MHYQQQLLVVVKTSPPDIPLVLSASWTAVLEEQQHQRWWNLCACDTTTLDCTQVTRRNRNTTTMSHNHHPPSRQLLGQWAQSAGHVVKSWTTPRYTLPDKNVASQVLMYRQLLHTKCRPTLRLSRAFQGTPAQVAVQHMPWWSEGMEETGQMVIAYDNLVRRLWLHGAIFPYEDQDGEQGVLLDPETNLPPIPHPYWVERLGFQQPDPVTDFRSGGVLSLALLVYMVESCPSTYQRFDVLPFAITSINVTDMLAKFLMLAKATDQMDALLSQKPFWNMFADPFALLVCQELSLELLADVVDELRVERRFQHEQAQLKEDTTDTDALAPPPTVTVFDFAHILATTERRVEHDLLGAGPQSVSQLRQIYARLKQQYQLALEQRTTLANNKTTTHRTLQSAATQLAGTVWQKVQKPGWTKAAASAEPTVVTLPPEESNDEWVGVSKPDETNFSIGDEDDDDDL